LRLPGPRVPASGRGPLPLRPPHPPRPRRRVLGRKRLRVFSVARPSRAGQGMDRLADLQELRRMWKASERTDLCLLSEGNEASTTSELRFYVVAGVGFEPA
jgi:hypothetical protein